MHDTPTREKRHENYSENARNQRNIVKNQDSYVGDACSGATWRLLPKM